MPPARSPIPSEVVLPAIVAILLGVFWLGVLVTVGFTVWRLLDNLKSLTRSVAELNERLAPTLQELEEQGQQAADLAERLQQRQFGSREAGSARPSRRRPRR